MGSANAQGEGVNWFPTTFRMALSIWRFFEIWEPRRTNFQPFAVLTAFTASAKEVCWTIKLET